MLALTRGVDQDIRIGDDIIVKVIDIRGHKVRLGIVAPRSVPVHRAELLETVEIKTFPANRADTGAGK